MSTNSTIKIDNVNEKNDACIMHLKQLIGPQITASQFYQPFLVLRGSAVIRPDPDLLRNQTSVIIGFRLKSNSRAKSI